MAVWNIHLIGGFREFLSRKSWGILALAHHLTINFARHMEDIFMALKALNLLSTSFSSHCVFLLGLPGSRERRYDKRCPLIAFLVAASQLAGSGSGGWYAGLG
jgi:hypothetical protein